MRVLDGDEGTLARSCLGPAMVGQDEAVGDRDEQGLDGKLGPPQLGRRAGCSRGSRTEPNGPCLRVHRRRVDVPR